MRTRPRPEKYSPLGFVGVRLDDGQSFETIGALGRVLLGESMAFEFGRAFPAPVPARLRYSVPASDASVRESAVHVEFALADQSESGFVDFARRFGRLGAGEALDMPVSDDGELFACSAEHYDTWVDCQRLMRLGLALAWYDPSWRAELTACPGDVPTGLTHDRRQDLAHDWLTLVGEAPWRTQARDLSKKTFWTRTSLACVRYRFSRGEKTWEFEGRGGIRDDSGDYRLGMLAALTNDVLSAHVGLMVEAADRRFNFQAKSLWGLMWLQCLTQTAAPIDYRWCLHCGTTFAAPYKRSDRLFCSPKCVSANHAWREETAIRLAREEGLDVAAIVERIYDERQLGSAKRRLNAESRVKSWISG